MGDSTLEIQAIAQAMAERVGTSHYTTWEALDDRWRQKLHATIAPEQAIAGVVWPANPEELAAVVAYAHQSQLPILPCGQTSKLNWGGILESPDPAQPVLVVSTARLNRLIDHAVGDLTVTVEAGMPFGELQAILAQAGQGLAIDPTFPVQATIGGIVATADTGSLRQRYNSVRDMLLGMTFVRADGQIAKAGGRVVKNVAGYDLMKLFTGSYGTLGILTQLTFRVYPLPAASQTVVVTGPASAIAQLSQTLLQSALTPVSLDLLSASVMQSLDVGQDTGLIVRFQSIAESVQEQSSKVLALAEALQLDWTPFTEAAEMDLWQRLQERMTASSATDAIACKIGIQPSHAMVLLQYGQLSRPGWYAQIHGASGLGRLFIDAPLTPETLLQVRAICQEHQGFLSVLEAPIALKQQLDVWGYSGNGLTIMQQIKQQFDPQSRLSPHRFVGGI
jgi:glycolate oxidase FAD binding subunit